MPRDGAVREVFEETGLHITITGLLGMWMDRYREDGTTQDTLNIYFTATLAGDQLVTGAPAAIVDARGRLVAVLGRVQRVTLR